MLPSPNKDYKKFTTLTEYLEDCHEQLFRSPILDRQDSDSQILEFFLQEYANFYAKKCLEIAADNVQVDVCRVDYLGYEYEREDDDNIEIYTIRDSITNINLPQHV